MGVETWLMHVLRRIDRSQFQLDFLVHSTSQKSHDEEIMSLGARILPCLGKDRPWTYARNFKEIIAQYGPYDIIHSHVHHFSGYVLRLAYQAGIPTRIVHSHSDTSSVDAASNFVRHIYLNTMRHWIDTYATAGFAGSRKAAPSLFGANWEEDSRWSLNSYGIDLEPFYRIIDRCALRAELKIPPDAFVVGHLGRFVPVKNHDFLVRIASELIRMESNTYLLLLGDGPLRPLIEEQVRSAGLADHVIFMGEQEDVSQFLSGAMDVFVMPSLYEGLPLAGIEALAAGLPLILSDTITQELSIIPHLVQSISLSQPPSDWAEAILKVRFTPSSITRLKPSGP